MTKNDLRALRIYVEARAKDLGLAYSWSIEVIGEPCSEDANADVHVSVTRNRATIRVTHEFRNLDPDEQRETIIHELVHIALREAEQFVPNVVGPMLGSEARVGITIAFDTSFERCVDWVARTLAPFHPLIKWPKKKRKK